jgi:hypothetical protein
MRSLAAIILLISLAEPAGAARIIHAGGNWAAIDFGTRCEARSKALWAKPNTEPFAGFAFDSAGPRHGQFYVRLARPARTDATVIVTVGSQPFLLTSNGQWAWSSRRDQQSALILAVRYASGMRVDYRDVRGARGVDRYALSGAPTAIDAAAAACAGKNGRL